MTVLNCFVEEAYSNDDYYFGQEAVSGGTWGSVKVNLPVAVADKDVLLGVATNHEQYTLTSVAGIKNAVIDTSYTALALNYFDYTQYYLGKEKVTTPAGVFEACKVYSETVYTASPDTIDTSTAWIVNRGTLVQDRNEASWGAKI